MRWLLVDVVSIVIGVAVAWLSVLPDLLVGYRVIGQRVGEGLKGLMGRVVMYDIPTAS